MILDFYLENLLHFLKIKFVDLILMVNIILLK